MKISKIIFPIIFFVLALSHQGYTQDPYFSQFHNAPLLLNPASTGSYDHLRINLNYRSQSVDILSIYSTPLLSVIYPLYSEEDGFHYGGIGFNLINDKVGENGALQTNGLSGSFGYNLRLQNDNHLSIGIQTGFYQRRISYDQLTSGNQWVTGIGYDANEVVESNLTNDSKSYIDFSAGFIYAKKHGVNTKYSLGLSAFHLNQPNQSFYSNKSTIPLKLVLHGNLRLWSAGHFSMTSNGIYSKQSESQVIQAGAITQYINDVFFDGAFLIGTWYRVDDAYVFSIGYDDPGFSVGISYDINASTLELNSGNKRATEIAISYKRIIGKKGNMLEKLKSKSEYSLDKQDIEELELDDTFKTLNIETISGMKKLIKVSDE